MRQRSNMIASKNLTKKHDWVTWLRKNTKYCCLEGFWEGPCFCSQINSHVNVPRLRGWRYFLLWPWRGGMNVRRKIQYNMSPVFSVLRSSNAREKRYGASCFLHLNNKKNNKNNILLESKSYFNNLTPSHLDGISPLRGTIIIYNIIDEHPVLF